MNRTLLHVLGALVLSSCVLASDYPYADLSFDQPGPASNEADPRVFFIYNNASTGSFVTFNTTLLLFSAGILLWGVAGAIALYYLLTTPADSGYSGYSSGSGYGSDSGYSGRGNRGGQKMTFFLQYGTSKTPCDWLASGAASSSMVLSHGRPRVFDQRCSRPPRETCTSKRLYRL
ncbi:hypothetical protein E2C01_008600 [Portunus trituberculatus]|uniref:Uncharacterized protein n=1 Tax=Portunus trituberculatus TaxID=210409 RepID=A0A5B7D187_PORTR|nr:hypothetical protein [Portunus trituberculatus]